MKKKLLILLVCAGAILLGTCVYTQYNKNDRIVVQDYKKAADVKKCIYEIDKYKGINGVKLIDNKIFTMNYKNSKKYSDEPESSIYYLSLYDITKNKNIDYKDTEVKIYNTKAVQGKKYNNTNISSPNSVKISPDKKYLIYSEPNEKRALGPGDTYLLDINSGKREKLNYSYIEYEINWIDGKYLLVNNNKIWRIIDLKQNIIDGDTFKIPEGNHVSIVGTDDIYIKDGKFNGCFYYNQNNEEYGCNLINKIKKVDINSKSEKLLKTVSQNDIVRCYKKGDTIIAQCEDCINKNHPFKYVMYDTNGTEKKSINFNNKAGDSSGVYVINDDLSYDGSKFAYVTINKLNNEMTLYVWDLKLDKVIKIAEGPDLMKFKEYTDKDKKSIADITTVKWDDNKNALLFRCYVRNIYQSDNKYEIPDAKDSNTYVVNFDE